MQKKTTLVGATVQNLGLYIYVIKPIGCGVIFQETNDYSATIPKDCWFYVLHSEFKFKVLPQDGSRISAVLFKNKNFKLLLSWSIKL